MSRVDVVSVPIQALMLASGSDPGLAPAVLVCARLGQLLDGAGSGGVRAASPASLRWESDDPLALSLMLRDETGLVRWVLGRDLLLAGLCAPAGAGDVVVGPWPPPAGPLLPPEASMAADESGLVRERLLRDLVMTGDRPSALLVWLRGPEGAAGIALPWSQVRMALRLTTLSVPFSAEASLLAADLDALTG